MGFSEGCLLHEGLHWFFRLEIGRNGQMCHFLENTRQRINMAKGSSDMMGVIDGFVEELFERKVES